MKLHKATLIRNSTSDRRSCSPCSWSRTELHLEQSPPKWPSCVVFSVLSFWKIEFKNIRCSAIYLSVPPTNVCSFVRTNNLNAWPTQTDEQNHHSIILSAQTNEDWQRDKQQSSSIQGVFPSLESGYVASRTDFLALQASFLSTQNYGFLFLPFSSVNASPRGMEKKAE